MQPCSRIPADSQLQRSSFGPQKCTHTTVCPKLLVLFTIPKGGYSKPDIPLLVTAASGSLVLGCLPNAVRPLRQQGSCILLASIQSIMNNEASRFSRPRVSTWVQHLILAPRSVPYQQFASWVQGQPAPIYFFQGSLGSTTSASTGLAAGCEGADDDAAGCAAGTSSSMSPPMAIFIRVNTLEA